MDHFNQAQRSVRQSVRLACCKKGCAPCKPPRLSGIEGSEASCHRGLLKWPTGPRATMSRIERRVSYGTLSEASQKAADIFDFLDTESECSVHSIMSRPHPHNTRHNTHACAHANTREQPTGELASCVPLSRHPSRVSRSLPISTRSGTCVTRHPHSPLGGFFVPPLTTQPFTRIALLDRDGTHRG
jgi:hypothetical protein